jgi:hypothetical protein
MFIPLFRLVQSRENGNCSLMFKLSKRTCRNSEVSHGRAVHCRRSYLGSERCGFIQLKDLLDFIKVKISPVRESGKPANKREPDPIAFLGRATLPIPLRLYRH